MVQDLFHARTVAVDHVVAEGYDGGCAMGHMSPKEPEASPKTFHTDISAARNYVWQGRLTMPDIENRQEDISTLKAGPDLSFVVTVLGLALVVLAGFVIDPFLGTLFVTGVGGAAYWTARTGRLFRPLILLQLVTLMFGPGDGGTWTKTFSLAFLLLDLFLVVRLKLVYLLLRKPIPVIAVSFRIAITTSPIYMVLAITFLFTIFKLW